MNNLIFIAIILFFVFLFYHSFFLSYKENFDKNKQIILLGDSILENSNYVEQYFNVESNIRKKHPYVLNLAQDRAVITNLSLQINHLKKKKINKNDIIFVSVGGNDILNDYRFRKKDETKQLNSIFNKYTKTILHLKKSISNKIVLLNIYAPPNVKDYHNIIDLWNKKQKEFASKNNIKILDIHSIVNHKNHFIKNIEPSNDGGRIIADAILKSL